MNFFKENNGLARKIFVGLFLFFFVFNFLTAQPAKAQAVTVISDLQAQAEAIKQKFKEAFDSSFKKMGQAAGTALIKSMRTFMAKFAQDSANWIASGNYNKGPMWVENPAEYFKAAGESAAADFIGTFGDEWDVTKKFGINLCSPQSPELNLKLKLSMAEINAPQPRCNFSEIKEAYSRMAEPAYWDKIGLGFEAGQNGLSLSRAALEGMEYVQSTAELQKKDNTGNDGAGAPKAVTGPVTGDAKAPKESTNDAGDAVNPNEIAKETSDRAKRLEESMKTWSKDTMPAILKESGMIFLDTIANKVQEKLLKFGMLSVGKIGQWIKDSLKSTDPLAYEAQLVGSRQASEAYFADFTKPTFSEIEDYRSQYITEASLDCSSNNSSPFCGALDDNFKDLLSRSQIGENVTVSEALNQGLLHGDWQLLGPGVPCTQNAYCYDNLVKLRILRILPIGWEIAAKKFGQGEITLKEAVRQFYSSTSSYYHLIDPNWLVVAPKARCGSEAFGSLFLVDPTKDSPGQRSKYCADIQNCVGEDPKTGVCNSWGYCLKEKNYWKIGGEACDSQFNTCTTYTSADSQVASYLSNTLDKGICTADNAGCRGYALSQSFSTASSTWNWQLADEDKKIFFSQNVETCDSANEGCTKFVRQSPEVFNQSLYLKKAPAYYNCYSEQADGLGNWPVNKADLYKIFTNQSAAQKTACANFAQLCSAEEKGCELYTPDNGNPAVPGILTANDQCPSECVGYEKYVEQAITQFSSSSVNYFIASSANSCNSDYAGCDEFINLEEQTAGGEQKEYYTELRTCSKDEADGATFYTWEGSDTTGYQLKTYTLKDADADGQPDYNTTDSTALVGYSSQCNVTVYDDRALGSSFNPDCREFYNRQGNKSYRLYSKTVTVSATACKKLRKTISDATTCSVTGGFWDAVQNFCTYLTITAEAKSCPAVASGCRAYKGNSGNNFQTVYSADFESGTVGSSAKDVSGWNGTLSSESTVVGGKSLKVTSGLGTWQTFASAKNKTYLVYFWAKGDRADLSVNFYQSNAQGAPNGAGSEFQNFKLNNNWASYTAGPFTVSWDSAVSSSTIKFNLSSGQSLYLDNVIVQEMTSNIYVIKNSWTTPALCDNVLGDPNGETAGGYAANPLRLVPQAQLGCINYQNRQGASVAAKSFTNLCRAEAVGCEELIDTANTETASSTLVNVLCELYEGGGQVISSISNQAIPCKDKSGEIRCDILPNQSGCRFDLIAEESDFDRFTRINTSLSHNTITDAESNEYKVRIKLDNQTIILPADRTIYLVNDSQFQCASDNVSCQAVGKISYNENGVKVGSTIYVKNNPEKYSSILCEEKAEGCAKFTASGGGANYFKDPVIYGNKLCEWKNPVDSSHPYGGWVIKGTETACYDNTNYHLYNNKDIGKYNGSVGLCPAEQNGCTEFIDPSGGGNSSNPQGQSYYLLNNDKIDKGSCGNQASLQKGCVLFNQTNKGDLLWNAEKTYAASEASKYELVNPISEPGNNDANVILKVKRDRVCGEWLACASTMKVTVDGQLKEICTELKNCDEAAITSGQYSNELLGKCAHWVEDSYPGKNKILTEKAYQEIPGVATFNVKDFSGYSVVDGYQISNLVVSETGLKSSAPGANGVFTNDQNSLAESCRGYASEEASFGQEKLCSLTKVTYGGDDTYPVDKYYEYNYLLDASGVCNGGYTETGESKKGLTCFADADCANDQAKTSASSATITPVCLLNKKVSREMGWNGYCLVTDKVTKACLQWFPLTVPSNSINIYALNRSAGYYPPESAGKYWCVEAKGNANRSYQRFETYLGFGANPGSSHYLDSDGWKEKKSISYGFIGRAASLTIVYNAFKTNNDYYYGLTPQGNAPPYYSDKDLFGYSTSWAKRSFSANDYEKTINIKELAAIGLKIKYRTTDEYPLEETEMILFPEQSLEGVSNGGSLEGSKSGLPSPGYYWSGPAMFTSGDKPRIYLDLVWSEINSATKNVINSSNYDFITENLCRKIEKADLEHRPNFAAIRFYFDNTTGNMLSVETKLCDASEDDVGGFAVDVVYYLKEMCTDIRQVVDNTSSEAQKAPFGILSKARTDRVWSQSDYWVGSGGKIMNLVGFMPYDQLNSPFGSLSKTDNVSSQSLQEALEGKKTNYEKSVALKKYGPWVFSFDAKAGTPLACANSGDGDCGNIAVCQDGPNEGRTCDPYEEERKYNGCAEEKPDGSCTQENLYCTFMMKSGKLKETGVSCKTHDDCGAQNLGSCTNLGTCHDKDWQLGSSDDVYDIEHNYCLKDSDCGDITTRKCFIGANSESGDDWQINYCYNTIYTAKDGLLMKENITWGAVSCATDSECQVVSSPDNACKVSTIGLGHYTCVGGSKEGSICEKDSDCSSETILHECKKTGSVVGLCVGGKNHGLPCGSNTDCPNKTYAETENNKDVEEIGTCVGISLETKKTFHNTTIGRSYELLYELFVKVFGTWVWNTEEIKDRYTRIPAEAQLNTYVDAGNWYTAWSKQDLSSQDGKTYIDGCPGNTQNKTYPNYACNTNANVVVKPPHVYSLLTSKTAPTGYTWGAKDSFSVNGQDKDKVSLGSGSGVATINFFAHADNDQMPIQRVAIDWGDGSPAYQAKGWYKNQKPWCASTGNKVCHNGVIPDFNRTCNEDNECATNEKCIVSGDNRLHFGNSTDACEENYFTFKHAYNCASTNRSWHKCSSSNGEPQAGDSYCWDEKTQTCHFKPRVQIMDNWGWCNGVANANTSNKTYKAYWNNESLAQEERLCVVNPPDPLKGRVQWTYFPGVLEVKP